MKYHKQLHVVTPDNPNQRGSCFTTVLACLLDKELDEVPDFHLYYWSDQEVENAKRVLAAHYCNGDYEKAKKFKKDNYKQAFSRFVSLWDDATTLWLAAQGYKQDWIERENYDQWLIDNPDTPYMVIGTSSRNVLHVVIYMNGKMIHDPHPSNEGLISLTKEPYRILTKVD